MPTVQPALRASSLVALGLSLAVLVGCAGGNEWTVEAGDLAERFLPPTRQVDYHPDSLGALAIRRTERQIELELSTGYETLHRRWSSSYRNLGVGRTQRRRSYATLWSWELALASLRAEGLSSLSRDRAEKLFAERRQEYQTQLQIDVYWFESEGNSRIAGPGGRVELAVGDTTYRPVRESAGPIRQTFLLDEGQALYRRNTFYFARAANGADILRGAEDLQLTVYRAGFGSRVRFAWTWAED
jgi:hypothetical protein